MIGVANDRCCQTVVYMAACSGPGADPGGGPCCISHAFLAAAAAHPDDIAVIHASGGATLCGLSVPADPAAGMDDHSSRLRVYDGDECFTFSQLLAAVESLSRRIRRILDGGDDPYLFTPQGYSSGKLALAPSFTSCNSKLSEDTSKTPASRQCPHIVGIYTVPSVEYIVSALSVLRCGAAFLPLDPYMPKQRILSIFSSVNVDLVVQSSSPTGDMVAYPKETKWLVESGTRRILFMSMQRCIMENYGQIDLSWPCEYLQGRMFCYVMQTSGSTGKPKCVCGTEKGLLNRFQWMNAFYPFNQADVLIFKTSVSFVDHLQEFLSSVISGVALVIPPPDVLKKNPMLLLDILKLYNVTRVTMVPSLVKALLPLMQSSQLIGNWNWKFLRILILSGEIFHLSLWQSLVKLLPWTSVLNLYGSTEVSGDCTYFDCKRLTTLLKSNSIASVPIGIPISNCDVMIDGDPEIPDGGELYVSGHCISAGYFSESSTLQLKSLDCITLLQEHKDHTSCTYYRTNDLVRKLETGDLVFLGRRDRTVKINGIRIDLGEIENTIREHKDVEDVAVVSLNKELDNIACIGAYMVTKEIGVYCNEHCLHNGGVKDCQPSGMLFKKWLVKILPNVMVPDLYFFMESLPKSITGKVDYALLESNLVSSVYDRHIGSNDMDCAGFLQLIKQVFRDLLLVEDVGDDDDFFSLGGNSISAAQVAYKLQIDMRFLYNFPSPCKLQHALRGARNLSNITSIPIPGRSLAEVPKHNIFGGELFLNLGELNSSWATKFVEKGVNLLHESHLGSADHEKLTGGWKTEEPVSTTLSRSLFHLSGTAAFGRCNKVMRSEKFECVDSSIIFHASKDTGFVRELWAVPLELCVDASPLVVLKDCALHILIGSHAGLFMCVDALSGLIIWETKLEGRIESSAAITGDLSQIIVGCYNGKIYFLDFLSGAISWIFQTGGEVKSQPVFDFDRELIWCGSHDHNLYALDYKKRKCVSKTSCGGSLFGSPVIDRVGNRIFVASTGGFVTAISVQESPHTVLWACNVGAPIFGSLSIACGRTIICCLVNGLSIALDFCGSVVWKSSIGAPIFAGPCISTALSSQVLICSRDGIVRSLDLEKGSIVWEYNVGDPITASAYVDEHMKVISDETLSPERLVCICSSSGSIHVLRITTNILSGEGHQEETADSKPLVRQFASIQLPGDIFSSPVMISGRIYVGCRDDKLHCIEVVN